MASQICESSFAFAEWLITGIIQKGANGNNTRRFKLKGCFWRTFNWFW